MIKEKLYSEGDKGGYDKIMGLIETFYDDWQP